MPFAAIKKKIYLFKQKLNFGGGLVQKDVIYHRESINRTPPCNLKQEDEELFSHEYTKELIEASCFEVKNGLVTAEGQLFCNHELVPGTEQGPVKPDLYNSILWGRRTVTISNQKGLIIHNKWTNGYYHWVTEAVPKLLWLRDNYDLKEFVLLLPESHRVNYIADFLSAFDLKKTIYFGTSENVFLPELVYVSEIAQTGNIRPVSAQEIRNAFRKDLQPKKALYISRKNAQRRRVIQEEQLLNALNPTVVDAIETDNMSVQEQVDLFSACNTLISIHGAGLTNMVFMPKDANVIELRLKDDSKNNCYFALASALNLNYYYLLCESDDSSKSTQDANFIVEADGLLEILEQINDAGIS